MKFIRILFAFIIYVLLLTILFLFKPPSLFNNDGKIKDTGFTDEDKSVLSLYIIIPILILVIYIILVKYGGGK
tara:strand:+ start:9329 stop:9547 length:219 start_codon:yes stop_codon:yes gene_type:complete